MTWKIMVIAFYIFFTTTESFYSSAERDEQEFVDTINKKQSTWTAVKRDVTKLKEMIKKQPMSIDVHTRALQDPSVRTTKITTRNVPIPMKYDSSEAYPECDIRGIKYQYQCGCCWAVSSSATMQNRLCIVSGGKINVKISAAYLVACCEVCADGCNFGTTIYSWVFMMKHGVVTGGNYGSGEGCYPFPLCPTCSAPKNGFDCPSNICPNYDYGKFIVDYDKYYVNEIHIMENDSVAMMEELFHNGPICATMDVYEDFMYYTHGIYSYVAGALLGGHNIRLIGYGSENGVDYWIAVNSWPAWGEDGTVRILRGQNEVNIETLATVGIQDTETEY